MPTAVEADEVRLLFLFLLLLLLLLAILPPGSTLAERDRLRLELRRRVPLALRAAALWVAEVGVDVMTAPEGGGGGGGGGGDSRTNRPQLLVPLPLLLATMAPFLSFWRRGDLPPPPSGGGASFSPSERYTMLLAIYVMNVSLMIFGFHLALSCLCLFGIAFGHRSPTRKAFPPKKGRKQRLLLQAAQLIPILRVTVPAR